MGATLVTVYVYELADPRAISESAAVLRRALYQTLGVSNAARHVVNVSASSGWVTYTDREGLWRPQPAPSLPEPATARDLGDKFLRNYVAALDRLRDQLASEVQSVRWLPQARPVELFAVRRPDGNGFDHWLYRLVPQLVAEPGQRGVDVFGATLELRIDANGKIVSFQARWRPLSGRRIERELRAFAMPPSDPPSSSSSNPTPTHALVYFQEGDGTPQAHLSPYHLYKDGDLFTVLTASDMSLVIDFVVKPVPDTGGVDVWGVVSGSSDRARFYWAYRAADEIDGDVTEIGFVDARTFESKSGPSVVASKIRLPPGRHLVMVNVDDPTTGAFKHYAELVASYPSIPDRRPLVA